MVIDYLERHHAFEGCFNFWDIGGYPNQDGRGLRSLLRAGRQDRMSEQDLLNYRTSTFPPRSICAGPMRSCNKEKASNNGN